MPSLLVESATANVYRDKSCRNSSSLSYAVNCAPRRIVHINCAQFTITAKDRNGRSSEQRKERTMMWRRVRQVHSGRPCRKDPLYGAQVPRTNPVSLSMQWDWQGSAHCDAASAVHFSGSAVSCNAGSEAANGSKQAALRRRIGRADLEREYQQVAAPVAH